MTSWPLSARNAAFRSVIFALALFLAGCAAQEQPVGIGRGTDDYKKSPCACATIDENTPPGFWEDIGNFKLG